MCAFVLHLAFPLTGWWWLTPFALAGLIASWCSVAPRSAVLIGYTSGLLFFALGFTWFGQTAGALLGPAAPILDIGPAAIEACGWAFAAALASFAAQRCNVRVVPFVAAAAFTLGEYLRSSGSWGCPLEQIGVAMIDSPLRPLAAFVGTYGITFAVALPAAALGWWLLDVRDRRRAVVTLAACAAVAVCTAAAWAFWPARHAPAPTQRVAAVQGGIAQSLKMSTGGLELAIARYTAMTSALRAARPSLVLWPETVINTDLSEPAAAQTLGPRFAALAHELHATLYVGSLARLADGKLVNALYIYDPHTAGLAQYAGARGFYGKEQLVPMAEHIPGPAWMRALPYADQIGAYEPMHNAVETVGGATPLICWESLFGDIAHARLRDDPSLLLVATDDAWFGASEFPYEHAMAASMRAVETGRWVLEAGATGISGIVAPNGDWTQRTALGGPATVLGDVGVPAPGPYAALGPFPIAVVLALVAFVPLAARRPR